MQGKWRTRHPYLRFWGGWLDVVIHDVVKFNIDWPAEKQEANWKSKLDENYNTLQTSTVRCWVCGVSHSPHMFPAPIFLNYALILGLRKNGYGVMPRVEQTLACYPFDVDSSLKVSVLATKLWKTISSWGSFSWIYLASRKMQKNLLDAPVSPPGLLSNAVSLVIERFQEAKRQRFIPCHSQVRIISLWVYPIHA